MRKKISIVTTAFNEEESIPLLVSELNLVFDQLAQYEFELIIVDNGSVDNTWQILISCKKNYGYLKAIKLTRNFGHQGGLLAGLHFSSGDAVITMDADLQHPPMVIPLILRAWEQGYKVVNTHKANNTSTFFRGVADKIFYWSMDKMAGLKLGQADFRLLDREVLRVIDNFKESEKFLRGLISWTGYSTTSIEYQVASRKIGQSKFTLRHLFEFALNGVTAFSVIPLRLLYLLGLITFFPSFGCIIYYLVLGIAKILGWSQAGFPSGWISVVIFIVFYGSINLLSLGILGEYLGRVFQEVKGRPAFLVEEKI